MQRSDTRQYGDLTVVVHPDAGMLAREAALQAAGVLEKKLNSDGRAAIILASANSQLLFLRELSRAAIDWAGVTVLHMDEYVGLSADHPASFRRFLREHFLDFLPRQATFYGIRGESADTAEEIRRYTELLVEYEPCLCVLGIGENGHLAFNDPPADRFAAVKVQKVTLDKESRMQQVGEGHFPIVDAVPSQAISLTIPALLAPAAVIGVVPERRKARAVAAALDGPVCPDCPASALRVAANSTLHLDRDSSSLLRPYEAPARVTF